MINLKRILFDLAELTRLKQVFDRLCGTVDKYDSGEISCLIEDTGGGVINKIEACRIVSAGLVHSLTIRGFDFDSRSESASHIHGFPH